MDDDIGSDCGGGGNDLEGTMCDTIVFFESSIGFVWVMTA